MGAISAVHIFRQRFSCLSFFIDASFINKAHRLCDIELAYLVTPNKGNQNSACTYWTAASS
jgi:hypothetical protein